MSWTRRTSDAGIRSSMYYFSNWNPYYAVVDEGVHPLEMPNCTTYSFGRFAEGAGVETVPTLARFNAEDWYNYNDGYERGQTPKIGAVCCFRDGNFSGDGHVCIVEAINQDGSIVVTESGYDAYFWRENVRHPGGAYPYSNSAESYIFQGFIYNPYVQNAPPEPADWITGNYYLSRSEMDSNAVKFYYVMSRLGVSYNAILGMLANIEAESTINPGIWESLIPYGGGYGLVQWTPYTKYSNWAGSGWENNGQKECEMILHEAATGAQWFSNWYAPEVGYPVNPPISLAEYIHSDLDPKVLADYWILYYEHPAESNIDYRVAEHQAQVDYYNDLLGGGYIPPVPKGKNIAIFKRFIDRKRGLI